MSDTVGITRNDISTVLALAEQFLDDWEEADARNPVSDRSVDLPFHRALFDAARPLLTRAAEAMSLLERCAQFADADKDLDHDVQALLAEVRVDRYKMQELSATTAAVPISSDSWCAVLESGLAAGELWRPHVTVSAPIDGRDAFYWRDTASDDPEQGPFETMAELVGDVLQRYEIDAQRLTRHCDLDNVTARAVLSFEAMETAKRHSPSLDLAA